jgi:hypothetical protein
MLIVCIEDNHRQAERQMAVRVTKEPRIDALGAWKSEPARSCECRLVAFLWAAVARGS